MKKNFYWLILILVFLFAGALLYFFFLDTGENDISESGEADQEKGAEINNFSNEFDLAQKTSLYSLVLDTEVLSLVLDGERIKFFDLRTKELCSVSLAGGDLVVLQKINYDLENLVWSHDYSKIVFKTKDGKSYFSQVSSGEIVLLGENIYSPIFSYEGSNFWYCYGFAGEYSINTGTPSLGLSDWSKVLDVQGKVSLQPLPRGDGFSYFYDDEHIINSQFYKIDKSNKSEILLTGEEGLDVIWSPDGSKIAFTKEVGNGKVEVWVKYVQGKSFRISAKPSLVSKVVWWPDSSGLYIAAPDILPYKGSGAQNIIDRLYEVNLEKDTFRLIYDFVQELGVAVDARDLRLSPHSQFIYFLNNYNKTLNMINLSKLIEK